MACKAKFYNPSTVTPVCNPTNITNGNVPLTIDMYEVTCGMIRGQVTCALGGGAIPYPVIVATNTTTQLVYYAIGDANGYYQMLVPQDPDQENQTYDVVAYCKDCYGDRVACDCGEAQPPIGEGE
ncbi:MAG: hypothetical protein PHD02_05100 [Bacilli bacterium]|nr:hypothetical protein [Bacilli bacterium]